MEKEFNDINVQKKKFLDDMSKAYFEAKKFAEKVKKDKKFDNYATMRKATCSKQKHDA
jgi:hypothetical protein